MIQKTIVCNEKMKRSVMWKKWIDIKFWNIIFHKIFKQMKRRKFLHQIQFFRKFWKQSKQINITFSIMQISKILFNFEKITKNIKIIASKSVSIINLCEICAFIKTHKLIFRRSDHDESINTFFEKTKFDLIQQISDYNENNWINHFTCFHIKAEFVYTHFKKNDCLKIIKSFLHMIKTRYNQIVQFFRMNDESILNEKFNLIIQAYKIIAKRTAPYTSD